MLYSAVLPLLRTLHNNHRLKGHIAIDYQVQFLGLVANAVDALSLGVLAYLKEGKVELVQVLD